MLKFLIFFFFCILLIDIQIIYAVSVPASRLIPPTVAKAGLLSSNTFGTYKTSIEKDIQRFINGFKNLLKNFKQSKAIKKKKKADNGIASLSYQEYRLLESFNEDMGKLLRIAITIPLSLELFLYSYVLFPVISFNKNPWSWKSFPSTFIFQEESEKISNILDKRRIQLLVNGLSWLKNNVIDDMNDEKTREIRQDEVSMIEKAMNANSLETSLHILEPFYTMQNTSTNSKSKVVKADLKSFPAWTVVKDACRSIGVEGVPNIFIVRRLNKGELIKYADKLREHDDFLKKFGVKRLQSDEVRAIITSLSSIEN